jgi:hypothetical protein
MQNNIDSKKGPQYYMVQRFGGEKFSFRKNKNLIGNVVSNILDKSGETLLQGQFSSLISACSATVGDFDGEIF